MTGNKHKYPLILGSGGGGGAEYTWDLSKRGKAVISAKDFFQPNYGSDPKLLDVNKRNAHNYHC